MLLLTHEPSETLRVSSVSKLPPVIHLRAVGHEPRISVSEGPTGLNLHLGSHIIPISQGHAERTLTNTLMHMRSGINPDRIIRHTWDHRQEAEPSCPCCKLEGRIQSALSRKADHRINHPRSGGTVQVRRLPAGLSGAQIRANDAKAELWHHRPEQPAPIKSTKQRIEDLI